MESTRQKTFTRKRTFLPLATVLVFLLLLCTALSAAPQLKVVRVTDGNTIKLRNNGKASIICLVGIDAPETSKMKNELGQPFSQKSTNYLNHQFDQISLW